MPVTSTPLKTLSLEGADGSHTYRLLNYAESVFEMRSPEEVLDRLHAISSSSFDLNVLGAMRIPRKVTDWASLSLGKTAFLHTSAPKGWWEGWIRRAPQSPPVGFALGQMAIAPLTLTETLQMLQPIGVDRWGVEHGLKYGIRDALLCPIGGRWLFAFWSRTPIPKRVAPPARIMLFAAASFAALRLDQLAAPEPATGADILATPRELAVLRLLSIGTPFKEVAKELGIGEETVRTHLKKMQQKLGVKGRTHAVAEAIRQHLIP